MKRYILLASGYIVPTFASGFLWHLVLFKGSYDALGVFRDDLSVPLGLFTIIVQGLVLAYLYPRLYRGGPPLREGARFGVIFGIIFWSIQAVAAAAKHHMNSVPRFLVLETGFFVLMFAIVGPVMAIIHAKTTEASKQVL
jgi:hypothetical protein